MNRAMRRAIKYGNFTANRELHNLHTRRNMLSMDRDQIAGYWEGVFDECNDGDTRSVEEVSLCWAGLPKIRIAAYYLHPITNHRIDVVD